MIMLVSISMDEFGAQGRNFFEIFAKIKNYSTNQYNVCHTHLSYVHVYVSYLCRMDVGNL